VYEVKGEYAEAALEYQEAIRADTNHAMFYGLCQMLFRPQQARTGA